MNKPPCPSPTKCRGITLIEVMVSLAVVSLLLAIILPAVQSVRESARKSRCQDNLRQLGIAVGGHESATRTYPPALLRPPNRTTFRFLSPQVTLLPYLDQMDLHREIDKSEIANRQSGSPGPKNYKFLTHTIPVFLCPSDPVDAPGSVNYRVCTGYGPSEHFVTTARPGCSPGNGSGVFVTSGKRTIHPQDIVDGFSNTALMSERVKGDGGSTYSPWRHAAIVNLEITNGCRSEEFQAACQRNAHAEAEQENSLGRTWLIGGYRFTWYNHLFPPNHRVPDCLTNYSAAMSARSQHPGGVNVLMADGAVHFVNEEIDLTIWQAISSRDGGELISFP